MCLFCSLMAMRFRNLNVVASSVALHPSLVPQSLSKRRTTLTSSLAEPLLLGYAHVFQTGPYVMCSLRQRCQWHWRPTSATCERQTSRRIVMANRMRVPTISILQILKLPRHVLAYSLPLSCRICSSTRSCRLVIPRSTNISIRPEPKAIMSTYLHAHAVSTQRAPEQVPFSRRHRRASRCSV